MTPSFQFKVVRIGEPVPPVKIDTPDLARDYWRDVIAKQEWHDENKEHLCILTLNTRYTITGYALISIGSLNESLCHPREVLRPAVIAGAYAILLMHNHPSGDPSPSEADHRMTRRVQEACKLLQITLLDHVIVAADKRFSLREAGVV